MKYTDFLKPLFVFLTLSVLMISCSEDDATEGELSEIPTAAQLRLEAQVDNTEDQSFSIVENLYIETEETGRQAIQSFFPDCAQIIVNPNGDGSGNVIVDFGDGCVLNNGATVTGTITLSFDIPQNVTRMVAFVYGDFTYNGNAVSGGGTLFRQFENGNGNPQSDFNADIEVLFSTEDVTANRTVSRTREWIEGVGSGTWTDNVFLVTGNWDTSFSTGFDRTGIIVEPLRREATCPFFVSGIVAITQNTVNGNLDFGDGTCDNIATVTIGDNEFIIQL